MILFGYCGVKFQCIPPLAAPAALNSSEDIESGSTTNFYECGGNLIAQKSCFIENSVWLLPFDVSSL